MAGDHRRGQYRGGVSPPPPDSRSKGAALQSDISCDRNIYIVVLEDVLNRLKENVFLSKIAVKNEVVQNVLCMCELLDSMSV